MEQGQSGWGKVRCENGWETWVDERRLISVSRPSPSTATNPVAPTIDDPPGLRRGGSRPRLVAVIVVVLLAAVAGAVALTVGSSGSHNQPGLRAGPTLRPSLSAPAGWHTSLDGLTVAGDQADLTATDPAGPRVQLVANPPAPDLASIKDTLAHSGLGTADDPQPTTVNGHAAVAISLTDPVNRTDSIVRRYVSVSTGVGHAALFILEDPQARDGADRATLDSIPTVH